MSEKIYVRLFDFRIYNEDLSEDSDEAPSLEIILFRVRW